MAEAPVHLIVAVLLASATGCGRFYFDPRSDAAEASNDSHMRDEGCWPRWRDHTIRFAPPRALAELNTTGTELDPVLASDQSARYVNRSS